MRIYLTYSDYDIYDYSSVNFHIKVEDEYDIEHLSKYIEIGDYLTIKQLRFWYFVTNVKYVTSPKKMIEITGNLYNLIDETIHIELNMEIELQIDNEDRIKKLEHVIQNIGKFERYKKSISTEHIQNEGFRILQEYINKKPYQVIYGNDVILAMKNELVQVVFVCWKFIKTQDDKTINILTDKNHKYNKTNIIVVWKYNENYKELKTLGGIVGVLY